MSSLWGRRKASSAPLDSPIAGPPMQRVRVAGRTRVSERAMLIRLDASTPDRQLARFPPGAHLDVLIKPGVIRQYSLVGSPSADDHYLVCVQREPEGRGGSIAVHDELADGDHLDVSMPRSTFELVPSARRALLVGGGIGLTPLVSMAEHLHLESVHFEFHVYARNASALPLNDQLSLRPWAGRIHRHFSDDGDSFRAASPPALHIPDPGGAVYICGPTGFMDLARSRALDAGWPAERVVVEQFSPSLFPPTGRSLDVVVASTGERVTVAADESIADALERHGYDSYRSCGQGYCGSCIVPVMSGTPDHRDDFQSPRQRAANSHINTCVSRALTPVLELDL